MTTTLPRVTYSITYEILTEEDCESGDVSESGFRVEDEPVESFRELVRLLEQYSIPNCSHGVPDWTSIYGEPDYRDGTITNESLHPGRDARSQRYWAKACKAAGIV